MLLETRSVEKVWGRETLPAPFVAPAGTRIGEIWFEPPPDFDRLLVKYIFTSENLSIQVHPGGAAGKDECWLVIDAEPGARLGMGVGRKLSPQDLRAAALDGSIEHLLDWHPVAAGDFFSIPAGTIHAIGGGVSLVEIQQNRDVTYRLYDYGRPRELHLDQAVEVARAEPYAPALRRKLAASGCEALIEGPYFRVDAIEGPIDETLHGVYTGSLLVIPLAGEAEVEGEVVGAGQCAMARALTEVRVPEGTRGLLACPLG